MKELAEHTADAFEFTFTLEGKKVRAYRGETVAVALLAEGVRATGKRPKTGNERGPFCLTGVCHECLVEIDGVSSQRACMTRARKDMTVRLQAGHCRLDGTGKHDDT